MRYYKPPANIPELIGLSLSLLSTLLSLIAIISGAPSIAYVLLTAGFAALLAAYCFHE